MSAQWLIGVGLAVVSAILSNLGLNLQKRNHLNNSDKITAEAAENEEIAAAAEAQQSNRTHKHKHRRRKHSHRKKHRVQPNDILIKKEGNGEDIDSTINDLSRRSSFAEATNNFDEISSTALDDSMSFAAPNSSDNDTDFMSNSNSFMATNAATTNAADAQQGTPTNHDEAHSKINYTKQLLWQCGLALVVIGSIFDFAALAFASQSLIAPLGSLTLVSNVFFAPLLLKEKLGRRDIICTLVIVAGAAIAVWCASHTDDTDPTISEMFQYFLDMRFILYAISVVAIIIGLRVMVWKAAKLRKLAHSDRAAARRYDKFWMKYHRFGYSAAAGIMGAQSVLFAKCTSMLFKAMVTHGDIMFVHPGTYGVLVGLGFTIFFQIRWLNSGLRLFPALYVVPVFQSFWILVSVISGMIFFQEYQGVMDAPWYAFGFCCGLALTIAGVYFLSQKSAAVPADEKKSTRAETSEHRRNSLSASSSFEPSLYMSSDNENMNVVIDVPSSDKHRSYLDLIRARKREKEVGTAKQRLLPSDDEKETVVHLPHSGAPKRASSKHSTVINGSRYLSPLPETNSPISSASSGQPRSPPRLRARSDGDQMQPELTLQEPAISEHEAALVASSLRPDTRPAVGSHSFTFASQFLHPRTAQLDASPRRSRRSASFDHIGDFEHTRFKKQTTKALDFGAALSALTSPRDGDDDLLALTPSPRRPRQSWQDVQRVAAFNAPGVTAFAQVLGVRNYEREPSSASSESESESESDSESSSEEEKSQTGPQVGSYGSIGRR